MFSFTLEARDGRARAGRLETPHGTIETPVFMPVGTAGAVKAVTGRDLEELGAQIILANTYHLMLRPGDALVAELGGLHGFTGWTKPFLTDSGGYQVFSLTRLRELTEEGVRFQSHLDGTSHLLSPERSIEVQMNLVIDYESRNVFSLFMMAPYYVWVPSFKRNIEQSVDIITIRHSCGYEHCEGVEYLLYKSNATEAYKKRNVTYYLPIEKMNIEMCKCH